MLTCNRLPTMGTNESMLSNSRLLPLQTVSFFTPLGRLKDVDMTGHFTAGVESSRN
jgi:hypothetical protein